MRTDRHTETYEIKNLSTGAVQFAAEIECEPSAIWRVKLGLAVGVAVKAGAYLRDADLDGAYLRDADLRDADLRDAYLRGANLDGANLDGAYLRDAYLRGADLRGADLRGAYLGGAYLRGADLDGANLGGLILLPARATRADGHEYFAWTSVLGGMVIKAGCREWVGEDAIQQARKHCQTVTSRTYRAEALRIVDHIEAAWNEHQSSLKEAA